MGGRPAIPMPKMPAAPPDYADQAVRDAATRESQRALTGSSRRRSFITSQKSPPTGQPVVPQLGIKTLLGQ